MNETVTSPLHVFQDYLADNGLKMTPQRRCIIEVFFDSDGHPAPEELYLQVREQDSSIGQATVYRTLKLLSDSGLAKEVHFGDGVTRYERKFGHSHHDHLICENCGKNIEVVDDTIEELQEKLAHKHGFTLTGHRMYLYGVCGDCRKKD